MVLWLILFHECQIIISNKINERIYLLTKIDEFDFKKQEKQSNAKLEIIFFSFPFANDKLLMINKCVLLY